MHNRATLLKELLPLIPFDGWTQYALRQAARNAGMDDVAAEKVFPGGVTEAIGYFFANADDELALLHPAQSLVHLRVHERIELLVIARLEYMLSYREAVRRALAHLALPWNITQGTKALYQTVDTMWKLAGDQSTDYNFYSKRALLAGVYSSTVLFWLNDRSPNQQESVAFLKRRLQDVAQINRLKKKLSPAAA